MKKIIIILVAMLLVFTACAPPNQENEETPESESPSEENNETDIEFTGLTEEEANELVPAIAEEATNKEVTWVYAQEVTMLNYMRTHSSPVNTIGSNTVTPLFEYDRYGELQPGMALSYDVSDDGLVYTFKLRENVNWRTIDGEVYAETVAQDFVDSAKWVLTPSNLAETANILAGSIKNAEEFNAGEITDFNEVGVKALDKYTVEYTLKDKIPYFTTMLDYGAFYPMPGKFMDELGDEFATTADTLLHNGAYVLSEFSPEQRRIYTKNPHYWNREIVFIEKITELFNKEAAQIAPEMFRRGEVNYLEQVPSTILPQWMEEPEMKEQLTPRRKRIFTAWLLFNFDPKFDDRYEPENWTKAVNNINFRNSLNYALDRLKFNATMTPYSAEEMVLNTISPPKTIFNQENGRDFVTYEPLSEYTNSDSYNPELAKVVRDKAMAELEGEVTFPVKVVYNIIQNDTEAQKGQLVKQELESILGKDYIEVILKAYPSSSFFQQRTDLNFGLTYSGWVLDYFDPASYTDPFHPTEGNCKVVSEITEVDPNSGKNVYETYWDMVQKAKAETDDMDKRFTLFAEAEKYALDQSFVIQHGWRMGGFTMTSLNDWEKPRAGNSALSWKGQRVYSDVITMTQYLEEESKWEVEVAR